MKLLIIGGQGTIGKKVSAHFSKKHEIIIAGRNSGDVTVDIADSNSIKTMFESTGKIDPAVFLCKRNLCPLWAFVILGSLDNEGLLHLVGFRHSLARQLYGF